MVFSANNVCLVSSESLLHLDEKYNSTLLTTKKSSSCSQTTRLQQQQQADRKIEKWCDSLEINAIGVLNYIKLNL